MHITLPRPAAFSISRSTIVRLALSAVSGALMALAFVLGPRRPRADVARGLDERPCEATSALRWSPCGHYAYR